MNLTDLYKEKGISRYELKIGDKLVLEGDGGRALTITDFDYKYGIIGLGAYGCNFDLVGASHKLLREDGTLVSII